MQSTKNKNVLVSADLAAGLVGVLETATKKGQLKGSEQARARALGQKLAKAIAAQEDKKRVRISVEMIANMLRIILMLVKPDPLVKAALTILGLGKFI